MKKLLAMILALCMLFALAACGEEDPIPTDPTDTSDPTGQEPEPVTLDTLAGWWTKPASFEGITLLKTFRVDAENGLVISYDDYGKAVAEYECWYDGDGFSIDAGELFGIVTYGFRDDQLLDDVGDVAYIRCEPMDPSDAPVTAEELLGVWYKYGDASEDYEHLVLEADRYYTQQIGIETGYGTWSIVKVIGSYGESEYEGPALELEPEAGYMIMEPWILEEGRVLYDAFHDEYYVSDALSEDERAALAEKYEMVRDCWISEDGDYNLKFAFTGEVWLAPDDGSGYVPIGTWVLDGGIITVTYEDGSSQEIDLSDEIYLDYCDRTLTRWETW